MSKIIFGVPNFPGKDKAVGAIAKAGVHLSKHSPEILVGAGVVGGVTAAVLACRATLHLEEIIDHHNEIMEKIAEVSSDKETYPEYTTQMATQDKYLQTVKTTVSIIKLYAPALIVGGLSIAAIFGGHHILLKRQAALTLAYTSVQKAYEAYRKRVAAEFGDEKEKELYSGVQTVVEQVEKNGKTKQVEKKVCKNPYGYSPYARVFDETSRWFKKDAELNKMFLIGQQNAANNLLQLQGHLFLNEVYDMLDLPRTPMGAVVGWVYGHGDSFVDFGIFDASKVSSRDFVNGRERAVWLDFNVDGVIYDMI